MNSKKIILSMVLVSFMMFSVFSVVNVFAEVNPAFANTLNRQKVQAGGVCLPFTTDILKQCADGLTCTKETSTNAFGVSVDSYFCRQTGTASASGGARVASGNNAGGSNQCSTDADCGSGVCRTLGNVAKVCTFGNKGLWHDGADIFSVGRALFDAPISETTGKRVAVTLNDIITALSDNITALSDKIKELTTSLQTNADTSKQNNLDLSSGFQTKFDSIESGCILRSISAGESNIGVRDLNLGRNGCPSDFPQSVSILLNNAEKVKIYSPDYIDTVPGRSIWQEKVVYTNYCCKNNDLTKFTFDLEGENTVGYETKPNFKVKNANIRPNNCYLVDENGKDLPTDYENIERTRTQRQILVSSQFTQDDDNYWKSAFIEPFTVNQYGLWYNYGLRKDGKPYYNVQIWVRCYAGSDSALQSHDESVWLNDQSGGW